MGVHHGTRSRTPAVSEGMCRILVPVLSRGVSGTLRTDPMYLWTQRKMGVSGTWSPEVKDPRERRTLNPQGPCKRAVEVDSVHRTRDAGNRKVPGPVRPQSVGYEKAHRVHRWVGVTGVCGKRGTLVLHLIQHGGPDPRPLKDSRTHPVLTHGALGSESKREQ